MFTCIVHGCDNMKHRTEGSYSRLLAVCYKHDLARRSGRVGANWQRDIHNFHRKSECADCGVNAYQLGVRLLIGFGVDPNKLRFRDIVFAGMKCLTGDHKKGRAEPDAHCAGNIQTLCPTCHAIKSITNGDLDPLKYKR